MSPEIRRHRGDDELAAAIELRKRVFCQEQGVSEEEELDGRDADALHYVALVDGRVVGTCRVLSDGGSARLGRLAVQRDHRRRGIADALLAAAETDARAAGRPALVLSAQVSALPLYERAGYAARGERYLEAGIEHVVMEKRLAV